MSQSSSPWPEKRKKLFVGAGVFALIALIGIGILAKNNMLPHTDAFTGKRTGWFGKELPKNASSSWNPLAPPLPTPTPTLSKEMIYAGSRLLSVVDSNAQEAPPADLAIWRPTSGEWWVMSNGQSTQVTYAWGTSGDDPVEGDYDGDGKTDFSVFRPSTGTWYIVYSSGSGAQFPFGQTGDIPAQADYDGDGKTDAAVFRSGTWYIQQSSNNVTIQQQFGLSSDTPAPADYDGDGRADVGVWRESGQIFYSLNSSNNALQTPSLGSTAANATKAVSADYDGDGIADYAIYDPSTANWYIRQSTTGTVTTTQWGNANDKEVPNDYDGDGKCDLATWRNGNGNWYIRQSASGNSLRQVQWGASGDIPVPAFYRR